MAATIKGISGTSDYSSQQPAQVARFSFDSGSGKVALLSLVGMVALATFAFYEMLQTTSLEWSQPQYSHGWIIPVIALFLLWSRRPKQTELSNADNAAIEWSWIVARALGAVAAIAYFTGLFESVPVLKDNESLVAGVCLAGGLLAGLLQCLVGQPYGESSASQEEVDSTPTWISLAVGASIVVLGLLDTVGVRLPGVHPGYIQILGLMTLLGAGIALSALTELGSRSSLAEIVFSTTLVALSIATWCYSVPVDMVPLARFSFITLLYGLFGMIGGFRLLRWSGPTVAFSLFMFPLPTIIEGKVLGILQRVAVIGSEMVYTIVGTGVKREGSELEVAGVPMEVAEACSGLSMSTILFAMALAMVLLIKRPWWDKLMILISAIFIAVFANVFRIVATGYIWVILHNMLTTTPETMKAYQKMSHDYAGILLMMPFAMGIYWLEFKLLSMLSVQEQGIDAQRSTVLGQ